MPLTDPRTRIGEVSRYLTLIEEGVVVVDIWRCRLAVWYVETIWRRCSAEGRAPTGWGSLLPPMDWVPETDRGVLCSVVVE